jgi:hypothetical protein
MIPSVKTIHARPAHIPAVRVTVEASILVCPHCLHVIGSFRDRKERVKLEGHHKCDERLISKAPSAAIPYN